MRRAFAQIDFRNIEREEVLAGEVRAQGFRRIEERRIARGAAWGLLRFIFGTGFALTKAHERRRREHEGRNR